MSNIANNGIITLENLATHDYLPKNDLQVKEELMLADIPVMQLPYYMNTEVKTRYIGVLNGFIFHRAWRYWVCDGNMPLDMAQKLYADHKDLLIRAGGHAGNIPPEDMMTEIRTPESSSKFITAYHIDTQLGLNKLAKLIRENDIHTINTRIVTD